jgi:hypothetical protein
MCSVKTGYFCARDGHRKGVVWNWRVLVSLFAGVGRPGIHLIIDTQMNRKEIGFLLFAQTFACLCLMPSLLPVQI